MLQSALPLHHVAEAPPSWRHDLLLEDTHALRSKLLAHPIYAAVNDTSSLRIFMGSHVYAVWDFMSLLKALQTRLTCVQLPWTHPKSRLAARLINEIVLAEESDEVAAGKVMSHFELYVDAMADVGAELGSLLAFVGAIRNGMDFEEALRGCEVPAAAANFVRATLEVATHGTDVEVAASFLLGREDLVPQMFRRILAELPQSDALPSFRLYLNRHIEVDEGQHGPAAVALLSALCGDDSQRWKQATEAAQRALRDRIALWDGVYGLLNEAH